MKKRIMYIGLGIILTCASFIVYNHIQSLKKDYAVLKQNLAASRDTLRKIDTRYGKLSLKYSSVIDENDSLVKMFHSYRGNIVAVDVVDIIYSDSFNTDTDVEVGDSLVSINFSYEDNIRSMLGVSSFIVSGCDSFTLKDINTFILSDSIKFNIRGGYGESDGLYERFSIIDDSRFNIVDMNSSIDRFMIQDEEFRRLSVGVYLGVGVGYDVVSRRVNVGPQIGVGVGYRLW